LWFFSITGAFISAELVGTHSGKSPDPSHPHPPLVLLQAEIPVLNDDIPEKFPVAGDLFFLLWIRFLNGASGG